MKINSFAEDFSLKSKRRQKKTYEYKNDY